MHRFLLTNQGEHASCFYSILGIPESPKEQKEQKGTMLVIFIYKIVVIVYLPIACVLKALQKNNVFSYVMTDKENVSLFLFMKKELHFKFIRVESMYFHVSYL